MDLYRNHRGGIARLIQKSMLVSAVVGALMTLSVSSVTSAASQSPGAPQHAFATSSTNNVRLHWTRAISPRKYPVLAYLVTSSPTSKGCEVAARRATTFSCVIGGLKTASPYTFYIKARNRYGFGPAARVVARTQAGGGPGSTTTTTTSTTTTTTTTTTPAPVRSLVLWAGSGQGAMSGPKFTVPVQATSWTENWSYDCTNFGLSGNFITFITGYGASVGTSDSGANQLGASGSGVNHYYDTGTFSIEIDSECDWTESIVAVGPIPSDVTAGTLPKVTTVLWTASGQGATSGPQFTVPSTASGWIEQWSYDCSNFGSTGNFITSITGYANAAGTTDAGVNELGASGSGSNYYYDSGTFSIQVNSECNWTESVGSY